MEYEFEGRTEEDAIEQAAQQLGIARDEFDVEILESQRAGFLKKGKTRIRVHTKEKPVFTQKPVQKIVKAEPSGDFEVKILDFIQTMIEKMGYKCSTSILFRESQKLGIKIDSDSAAILIGKKGKNLDAIQLLANVYAGCLGHEDTRVIVDSENYRIRREESIVKMAYEVAETVRQTRNSILLEPMNPFERRIVHTTLNDIVDIDTKSEGEGLYKQVRVMFRGRR